MKVMLVAAWLLSSGLSEFLPLDGPFSKEQLNV